MNISITGERCFYFPMEIFFATFNIQTIWCAFIKRHWPKEFSYRRNFEIRKLGFDKSEQWPCNPNEMDDTKKKFTDVIF